MPQFMITVQHVDGIWDGLSDGEREKHQGELASFSQALEAAGSRLVFLSPADGAKTVRVHPDGSKEITGGPYNPGPEQIGLYYIVEAGDWDEAVAWADRGRFLCGSNEVRQILNP